jgi:hypothetical protein
MLNAAEIKEGLIHDHWITHYVALHFNDADVLTKDELAAYITKARKCKGIPGVKLTVEIP